MNTDSNAPTLVTRTGALVAAATVVALAAALAGTPDPTDTDARPVVERPRVLGYGSGV